MSLNGKNAGTFVDFGPSFTICETTLTDVAIHTRSVCFVYNIGLLSSYSLRFAPDFQDFGAVLTFSSLSVALSPFSTCGQVLKGESNSLFVFKDKITRYQRKIAFSSKLKASTLRIQIVGKKSHRPRFLFFLIQVALFSF